MRAIAASFGFLLLSLSPAARADDPMSGLRTTAQAIDHLKSEQNDRAARCGDSSQELQTLAAEDQADRQGAANSIDWGKVSPRDEARRRRVGELAAGGCLTSAADYAAAALVYQHGTAPEHYFAAFQWWQKAVELGDATQKTMMVKGADRYLNSIGYKQLFATQASKPTMNPADCWCLEEVDQEMSEERRLEYTERSVPKALEWVDSLNAQTTPKCGPAAFCEKNLKDPPKGTLPGLW